MEELGEIIDSGERTSRPRPGTPPEAPRGRFLRASLILMTLLTLLMLQAWVAAARLAPWDGIRNDLQTELPGIGYWLVDIHGSGLLLLGAGAMTGVLGLGVLKLCSTWRVGTWICLSLFSLGLLVPSVQIAGAAARLDDWLAGEMELTPPLTPARVRQELEVLGNPNASPEEIRYSARAIRATGLKHAVGLIQIEPESRQQMILICQDETRPVSTRFFAAWALMPIDHKTPAACSAIASAIRASLADGEDTVREFAETYRSHPCLETVPASVE